MYDLKHDDTFMLNNAIAVVSNDNPGVSGSSGGLEIAQVGSVSSAAAPGARSEPSTQIDKPSTSCLFCRFRKPGVRKEGKNA